MCARLVGVPAARGHVGKVVAFAQHLLGRCLTRASMKEQVIGHTALGFSELLVFFSLIDRLGYLDVWPQEIGCLFKSVVTARWTETGAADRTVLVLA